MQNSVKLSQDTQDNYTIKTYKNQALDLRFTIKDQDDALINLNTLVTTFSVYLNMDDLDSGTAELTETCVNVADQDGAGAGLTDLEVSKTDMSALERGIYRFVLETDGIDKMIMGWLEIE
jgi:hypothetical protein